MSLLSELKRRRVGQVAVVYCVVAWLIVQIVAVIEAPLSLPDWVDTLVIVLVIAGFPLALILGWAYDISPHGIVRTDQVPDVSPSASTVLRLETTQDDGSILPNSVAVLPLDNLSLNPDDAYFAAGIHEEILNYLAKVEHLSVIARTSVKRYEKSEKPISEIAKELRVGAIMEGSVRYSGDRVRVTAQLIDARTDHHIWSEVYERDLADVFSIQADIASNIARTVAATFSLTEQKSIDSLPKTTSSEAHALYLRAQAAFAQQDTAIAVTAPPDVRAKIHGYLDHAIQVDPKFAHPYAVKALLYSMSRIRDPINRDAWLNRCAELDELVQSNAGRALELNPNLGQAFLAKALNSQGQWHEMQAREAYERAIALRPTDAEIQTWYATLKWSAEDFRGAIELGEKAVSLDPGNALAHAFLGMYLHAAQDYSASISRLQRSCAVNTSSPLPYLLRAMSEVALQKDDSALESLTLADQLLPDDIGPTIHIHLAYGFSRVGRRSETERLLVRARSMVGDRHVDPIVWFLGELAQGNTKRAAKQLEAAAEHPELSAEMFVRPLVKQNAWCDPVLDEPEFSALRRRLAFGT